ncbi:MAG: type IX secretion system membrane protein PorP/SprF [Prevotellaceae bacterium]|nr:type IX secretion system membrane protein PorP/SprF [Prevotellaceae bacterium]
MIKQIMMIATLLFPISSIAQQDSYFSQGVFNSGYINPGSYGIDDDGQFCITAINRMQTKDMDGSPVTTVINVNGPLNFINSGVSISFFNDKIGFLQTPGFNIGYSYMIEMPAGKLGIGISLGMINSKFDKSDWRLPDGSTGDIALPINDVNATTFDAGIGAYYTHSSFFAGLSCLHINRAAVTKASKKTTFGRTFYVMAGYRFVFGFTDDYELRPSIYISTDLGVGKYSLNSHLFYKKKYWAGLSYRLDEAIVFNAGLELMKNLKIGYSYDYFTTDVQKYGGGAHEFLVSYRFSISTGKGNNQRKSIRYL